MQNETVYNQPVTLRNIIRFAVPTIVMTVFMSFYTMVDGLFVSNLIGTDALSAVNLTAPVIALVTAVSTMLATGGSAVIMKKMGEQKTREAKPVVVSYCRLYLSRYLIFTIPILLMNNFTLYMIAAGKSALSMVCSIAGGVLNMVLDYVLIAVLDLGIAGAAIATGCGYCVTAAVGLVVFSGRRCMLHFVKPVFRLKSLFHAAANGSSEMATALVTGIVTMMFN